MNSQNITTESCPMLEALEAAHAIVCTFSVENLTQDTALHTKAVIKMLRGVDTLLSQAQESESWSTTIRADSHPDADLPETWMFKAAESNTFNADLLGTACCRAQGVIAVYIALLNSSDGRDSLSDSDYTHGLWGLEGIIAQAVASVQIARPEATAEGIAA